MRYALALALIVLAGCSRSPEFRDWHEELAYLRAQSNTMPEQFRRLTELSGKEDGEKFSRSSRGPATMPSGGILPTPPMCC
jgi:hypothetical protein